MQHKQMYFQCTWVKIKRTKKPKITQNAHQQNSRSEVHFSFSMCILENNTSVRITKNHSFTQNAHQQNSRSKTVFQKPMCILEVLISSIFDFFDTVSKNTL